MVDEVGPVAEDVEVVVVGVVAGHFLSLLSLLGLSEFHCYLK